MHIIINYNIKSSINDFDEEDINNLKQLIESLNDDDSVLESLI